MELHDLSLHVVLLLLVEVPEVGPTAVLLGGVVHRGGHHQTLQY